MRFYATLRSAFYLLLFCMHFSFQFSDIKLLEFPSRSYKSESLRTYQNIKSDAVRLEEEEVEVVTIFHLIHFIRAFHLIPFISFLPSINHYFHYFHYFHQFHNFHKSSRCFVIENFIFCESIFNYFHCIDMK